MKVAGCGQGKVLTPEEFSKIKQHIHFKYQVFFDIMWMSGARVSEICKFFSREMILLFIKAFVVIFNLYYYFKNKIIF